MSYDLLSQPIRKFIRDKGWESLRPIQVAAIARIMGDNGNYILSSRTASGKTEAAFLPILSKVNFHQPGVRVLYISPLIALINDQFFRVEELCRNLEVRVTKWHGEASRADKDELVKNPEGIVLITPESLEAMFTNAPFKIKALFPDLNYLIIDEIHSFIGTDRGVQLMSIISRLRQTISSNFSIVGLSATIGDPNEAKRLTGDIANTKVLVDRTPREMNTSFHYFHCDAELSPDLIEDLYQKTAAHKVLIFPNSRGRAEEIAVKLKRIADKSNGHPYYFSHHSSVDKELRTYIEDFAKNNKRNNFCIACTSTLELGIDIGTVDTVVQIDATFSIASLIQRVGRSGRRDGEMSILLLYSTNPWSLLQSLACWLLYNEGFIEPFAMARKPYDILLHQLLSTVKQLSGCSRTDLIERMTNNYAFEEIAKADIEAIIDELLRTDMLEKVGTDLIIGLTGERTVNNREFYSVFISEPNLKVINAGKTIGEIPFSPSVIPGENIMLAARIWKIVDVDQKAAKIMVVTASDGKKPIFGGTGGNIHPRIREKMLEILMDDTHYDVLDESSIEILRVLRKEFIVFPITTPKIQRPVISKDDHLEFYTFNGSKINLSLLFLLTHVGYRCNLDDKSSVLYITTPEVTLESIFDKIRAVLTNVDQLLTDTLTKSETLLDFSKWGRFLPIKYQCEILKERYFDFGEAEDFINKCISIFPISK